MICGADRTGSADTGIGRSSRSWRLTSFKRFASNAWCICASRSARTRISPPSSTGDRRVFQATWTGRRNTSDRNNARAALPSTSVTPARIGPKLRGRLSSRRRRRKRHRDLGAIPARLFGSGFSRDRRERSKA
jgi:hypothetical protein